jgi:hypothetical protein
MLRLRQRRLASFLPTDGNLVRIRCYSGTSDHQFNFKNNRFLQGYLHGYVDGKDNGDDNPAVSAGVCTKIN